MGLRFDPVGGGQFKQALTTIIEAEKQPIKTLEGRKNLEETKFKLFGEFKSKFGSVQTALDGMIGFNKFKELKAELGDGKELMEVTLDKERANVGSWEIEIKELAQRSSMISGGFTTAEKPILGVGYVNLQMGDGSTREIYVDEASSSLNGLATKINSIPDSVVKATVVKDAVDPEKPYRLILSAKDDGLDSEVNFPQLYFMGGEEDFFIDKERGAQNAILDVNGYEIELEGNDVPDFFSGVGINLKQAKPGQKFTFTINPDKAKVAGKIKSVVDGLNGVLEFINKQNQVNEKSDTRSTFAGDTSLQNIEFRLRNLLHEGFATHPENPDRNRIVHMNELGIEFDKKGNLTFKEEKFQKALDADFEGVAQAVSGEYGFMSQLKSVMVGFADPYSGLIKTREDGFKNRIRQIDGQIEQKTRNLEKRAESLTAQFSRLQGSLSAMQRQQNYLSATLGGGGGNPISQLLG